MSRRQQVQLLRITKRIRMLANFPESGAPLSSIVDFETDYRFSVITG